MNVPVYHVTLYLKNRTTNFDETLHALQACPEEGFSTIGMSGYSLVWKLGRVAASEASSNKFQRS